MQPPDFQQALAEIRIRFLERIRLERPIMQGLVSALTERFHNEDALKKLLFYVHRYSGNGLTFGFALISERAKLLEALLDNALKHPSAASRTAIEQAYRALEEALVQAVTAP